MAKPDWGSLQQRFLSDHAKTGISPKDWCEAQGLNYSSARRYIKKSGAQSAQTSAHNKLRTAQTKKLGKQRVSKSSGEECADDKCADAPDTKPIRGTRNSPPVNAFQPGNQHALKHGGYSRRLLLKDDVIEDAKALTLEDELFRLRANNLVAAESIGRWLTQLEDAQEPKQIKALRENIKGAENAMMRNTVRIESITGTLATLGKIYADTDYRIAATEKVGLEADRLRRDAGIDDGNGERDLNDFYSDLQADTQSGA